MVQRQSITAESIYGDEFDADPVVTLSDVESPSEGQNSNPESEDHTSAKDKRHQFLRQNSVLQYMRDQKSIDDDPVNILQKMQTLTEIFKFLQFSGMGKTACTLALSKIMYTKNVYCGSSTLYL